MKSKSFTDLLREKELQFQQQTFLFTKLVQNKEEKMVLSRTSGQELFDQNQGLNQQQINDLFSRLQILKLEKANLIADKHIKTGKPIRHIMKDIMGNLPQQIYATIVKEPQYQSLKVSKCMHETMQNTNAYEPASLMNSIQNDKKKKKQIQFTLGNKQSEKGSSSRSEESGEYESQVSQFLTKVSTTRLIKQKLMGIK